MKLFKKVLFAFYFVANGTNIQNKAAPGIIKDKHVTL